MKSKGEEKGGQVERTGVNMTDRGQMSADEGRAAERGEQAKTSPWAGRGGH